MCTVGQAILPAVGILADLSKPARLPAASRTACPTKSSRAAKKQRFSNTGILACVRLFQQRRSSFPLLTGLIATLAGLLTSCGNNQKASAHANGAAEGISVGVAKVGRKALERTLTVSSELVPFQEIDVYAKE